MYSDGHRDRLLDVFSGLFPIFLLLGLVLGFAVAFAIGQPELGVVGFATVGPPFLTAGVLLLVLNWRWSASGTAVSAPVREFPRAQARKLLATAVFTATSLAVWAVQTASERPLVFFVLLALAYLSVFYQIWLGASVRSVFTQLLILLLLSVYSVTLKYGFYYGYTDIIGHLQYSQYVVDHGRTVPGELSYLYEDFPLYHIWLAIGAEVLGLDVATGWKVLSPLAFFSTVLVTYRLALLVTERRRLSLFAAAFYAVTPTVVFYAQYFITRTAAFVGFLFIVYLLLRHDGDWRILLTTLIFSAFLLLVHQVTAPQVLILLLLLFVALVIANTSPKHLGAYILFLGVLTVGYWLYVAFPFTEFIIQSRVTGVADPEATVTGNTDSQFNSPNFYLHNYIFIFLALVGLWYLVRRRISSLSVGVGVFMLATAPIYIPSPLGSLWITKNLLRFDRFALQLSPFVAILLAVGLYVLLRNAPRSGRAIIVGVLVGAFVFTAVTSGSVAPVAVDAGEVSWTEGKNHFTTSELHGIRHVEGYYPSEEGEVRSDHAVARAINQYYAGTRWDTPARHSIYPFTDLDTSVNHGTAVLRTDQYRNGGITVGRDVSVTVGERDIPTFHPRLETRASKTYDSPSVSVYSGPRRSGS